MVSNSIFGLDRLTQLAPDGCRTRRWQDLLDLCKIYSVLVYAIHHQVN